MGFTIARTLVDLATASLGIGFTETSSLFSKLFTTDL